VTADVDAHFHLHERARLALGDDAATTLMTRLPRDVDQIATKQDLTMLKKDLLVAMLRGVFAMNISIATFGIAVAELVR
jgi:hypothetical protein